MSAHTPGPWSLRRFSETAIEGADARPVASTDTLVGHSGIHAENAANARLIAAAPDLLEACEAAFGVLSDEGWTRDRVQDTPAGRVTHTLDAAIAKARGEQP